MIYFQKCGADLEYLYINHKSHRITDKIMHR